MASNLPAIVDPSDDIELVLRQVLCDVLGLSAERAAELDAESGLFGHLPELDSMAVAGLLTELEDRLDIIIEDDEVDGEMLETFGGLLAYLTDKRSDD
ncbi:MAG: acyl carrier protein [Erythrobacter sp.]|nr:acyl carrier protein [Erythrobacter sp.]